jgi:hypothetical protein
MDYARWCATQSCGVVRQTQQRYRARKRRWQGGRWAMAWLRWRLQWRPPMQRCGGSIGRRRCRQRGGPRAGVVTARQHAPLSIAVDNCGATLAMNRAAGTFILPPSNPAACESGSANCKRARQWAGYQPPRPTSARLRGRAPADHDDHESSLKSQCNSCWLILRQTAVSKNARNKLRRYILRSNLPSQLGTAPKSGSAGLEVRALAVSPLGSTAQALGPARDATPFRANTAHPAPHPAP